MKPPAASGALDCSRVASALFWGCLGGALALSALMIQDAPNWASVLRVGSSNPLRHQIERELGPVTTATTTGHDGQLYYLIARDPFATGSTVEALIAFDTPRYRYRRILFPLLAGGFGQFSPKLTLFGMIFLTAVGMALTSIGVAELAFRLRTTGTPVLIGILNLGAIVSVMLLTVDVLALGLALVGVALLGRRHLGWALLCFALAALTKETSLLVPWALSAWECRERNRSWAAALLVVPTLPLACWSLWLILAIPGIPEPGLLAWPLQGVFASVPTWSESGRLKGIQGIFALYTAASFLLAIGMVVVGRHTMIRWLLAFWLVLACFTGVGVWGIPTNIARAFSILWPLGILLLAERLRPPKADSLPAAV